MQPDADDGELNAADIISDIETFLGIESADKPLPVAVRELPAEQRRALIFRLRANGRGIQQIAEAMGYSHSFISKESRKAIRHVDLTRYLDDEIKYDKERLDALISAYWDRAVRGDLQAGKFILEVMNRKHKLLGMDAPKRVDVRMLVQQWAESRGLGNHIQEIIDVTRDLLPEAE